MNTEDRVPKIIWQTYKSSYEDLPLNAKKCAEQWQALNPEYEYRYFTDQDIYSFTEKYYGLEMLNLMQSLKVPVMKIDLWRILVIYEFGGVYADIDTTINSPLDKWVSRDGLERENVELGVMGNNFVVSIENSMHYTQWAFMAKPKNPIVKSILDVILDRCKNVDYTMKEFVHYHTGPDAFTEGIRKYFDLPSLKHECYGMEKVHACFCGFLQNESLFYVENEKMKKEKFYCFAGNDWNTFTYGRITHHFGSFYWKDEEGYTSWVKDPLVSRYQQ